MAGFRLTRRARDDLRHIARFTGSRWGVAQRDYYIKQLDEAFHVLAASPSLGKDCSDIRAGYRKFPQGSHVIFYRQSAGDDSYIEIIRILHKRMDVDFQL